MMVWTVDRPANSCFIFTPHRPRPSNIIKVTNDARCTYVACRPTYYRLTYRIILFLNAFVMSSKHIRLGIRNSYMYNDLHGDVNSDRHVVARYIRNYISSDTFYYTVV
jgi:hypothetical protein